MQFLNTPNHYGWLSRSLHWGMAIMLFTLILLGWFMDHHLQKDGSITLAMRLHLWIGLSVLVLVILRWVSQQCQPKPQALPNWSYAQNHLKKWTVVILYLLMITAPLSGLLMTSFDDDIYPLMIQDWTLPHLSDTRWLKKFFEAIHEQSANLLILGVALHALAAFKHHFFDHDDTLKRMLKPQKKL